MIVCICHGISDKDVDQMVQTGMSTPEEISSCSGLGTDCGSCLRKLRNFIEPDSLAGNESEKHHSGDQGLT